MESHYQTGSDETVSVVGLGKLGSPLAACLASKGFRVIGVDADPQKVKMLQAGHAPIFETGLEELTRANHERLSASSSVENAVEKSLITFVVVGTPSESSGNFSLKYVLPVCESIGRALQRKSEFHLIVLTSTVTPRSTGGLVKAALERASGKTCGVDFGLCYSPEFIALGSVICDFLNPDFVLIGESDRRSGDILEKLYLRVCESKPAVARMNFINAEITKLAVNSYVTTKISFANMLARICERAPGADVDVVSAALGLDSRIGIRYLKGAIGYGGPCFPRDNRALATFADSLHVSAGLAQATHEFNQAQAKWLADYVAELGAGRSIGILGLTYKPDTEVVEEAVGLLLARALASRGASVTVYDPAGMPGARRAIGDSSSSIKFATSANDCIASSQIVVVTTPWREFNSLAVEDWTGKDVSTRIVVDCWRTLKHLANCERIGYIALGRGPSDEDSKSAS